VSGLLSRALRRFQLQHGQQQQQQQQQQVEEDEGDHHDSITDCSTTASRTLEKGSTHTQTASLLEERSAQHAAAAAVEDGFHSMLDGGGPLVEGAENCELAAARHVQFCHCPGATIFCTDDCETDIELQQHVGSQTRA